LKQVSTTHSTKNEESLLLEMKVISDAPWCEIRQTHASHRYIRSSFSSKSVYQEGWMVKGRNEPCKILQVAEIIAALHGEDLEQVSHQLYQNTMKLFFPSSQ
jgi:TatD DNase family protein